MSSSSSAAPLQANQLSLPFVLDPASLRDRLLRLIGKTIILTITDNSSSLLSVRKKDGKTLVRLHKMFLHADEEVLKAVSGFIAGEKSCGAVIRNYIKENGSCLKNRPVAPSCLRPHGNIHCLTDIFARVNRTYFSGRISAGITWGKNRPGRRARRITLGSFCRATNIIRINLLLDRKKVPVFFLEFIVYHEMLHADLGFTTEKGRRRLHTKEFRIRERAFAEYEKAVAWEKRNL
jgi:hypothetical protein